MRVLSCSAVGRYTSLAVGMLSGNHPPPAPRVRKRVTSNLYGVSMTAPVKKNPSGRAIRAEFVRAGSDHSRVATIALTWREVFFLALDRESGAAPDGGDAATARSHTTQSSTSPRDTS